MRLENAAVDWLDQPTGEGQIERALMMPWMDIEISSPWDCLRVEMSGRQSILESLGIR
jgi:hypothetical protein